MRALLPTLVSIGVAAHLAACGASRPVVPIDDDDAGADASVEGGAAAPEWRVAVENLDGALLSIWGTSERDVWAVGGPLGNEGFDALVLRYDGVRWRRHRPGDDATRRSSYWWVHGSSASDVWLVGEHGRITHHDGAAFREVASGTDATLFGVWAAAPDDAWAVGGTPDSTTGANAVVLHWDGAAWKPEPTPEDRRVAFFKVWGSSKDDVYVVGEAGTVWHRAAGTWKREAESLATGRLTTVAGCSASEIYAVGGRDLLVSDGTTWSRAELDPALIVNDLNGVACDPASRSVVVVGGGSLKLRRTRGGTWESDFGMPPLADLHGAWVDPGGAPWGVGGQFLTAARPQARRNGVIGYRRALPIGGVVAEE